MEQSLDAGTVTTGEAAKRLGVGIDTVKNYLAAGHLRGYRLPAVKGSRHWRIYRDSLEELVISIKEGEVDA